MTRMTIILHFLSIFGFQLPRWPSYGPEWTLNFLVTPCAYERYHLKFHGRAWKILFRKFRSDITPFIIEFDPCIIFLQNLLLIETG